MEIQFEQNRNFNQFHRDRKYDLNRNDDVDHNENHPRANINFEEIDDEKIIPGMQPGRNFWNSVTFDHDDLISGLPPL